MRLAERFLQFLKAYSTGVVAASLSVSFATYMLLTGGGNGGVVNNLVPVRHVAVVSPLKERPRHVLTPSNTLPGTPRPVIGTDIITGSIKPVRTSPPREEPQRARTREDDRPAPRYVLRFAAPRMALVEGAGRLWRVEPGDMLPGAGRVVEIRQRQRNRWVVRTFDGRHYREIGQH